MDGIASWRKTASPHTGSNQGAENEAAGRTRLAVLSEEAVRYTAESHLVPKVHTISGWGGLGT